MKQEEKTGHDHEREECDGKTHGTRYLQGRGRVETDHAKAAHTQLLSEYNNDMR